MAIDSVGRSRRIVDAGATQESRASTPLGVAGGIMQISDPTFRTYGAGQSYPMADSSGDRAVRLIRCDRRGKSAICGSAGLLAVVGDSAGWRQSASSSSMG